MARDILPPFSTSVGAPTSSTARRERGSLVVARTQDEELRSGSGRGAPAPEHEPGEAQAEEAGDAEEGRGGPPPLGLQRIEPGTERLVLGAERGNVLGLGPGARLQRLRRC